MPLNRESTLDPRDERGQILLLFVVMFTVLLAMAAFAIDLGFWFGRRTVVQKDAALAARGAALVYVGDIASGDAAADRAREIVDRNHVGALPTVDATSDINTCLRGDGTTVAEAPSIEVTVSSATRGLFTSLPIIDNSVVTINIQGRARACVGGVATWRIDDNRAIPIVLSNQDDTPGGCFGGGQLLLGTECVIFGEPHPEIFAGDPPDDECHGGPTNGNEISSGMSLTCTIGDSTLNSDNSPPPNDKAFREMEERLNAIPICAGGSLADSFRASFGHGDGEGTEAYPPESLSDGGLFHPDDKHVYVINDCFANPRIAVLPISDDSGVPVLGFAVVFITGCYLDDAPPPPFPEINAGSVDQRSCEPNVGNQWANNTEIRAVPIQLFIIDGAVGEIDTPAANGGRDTPLTIQTVE